MPTTPFDGWPWTVMHPTQPRITICCRYLTPTGRRVLSLGRWALGLGAVGLAGMPLPDWCAGRVPDQAFIIPGVTAVLLGTYGSLLLPVLLGVRLTITVTPDQVIITKMGWTRAYNLSAEMYFEKLGHPWAKWEEDRERRLQQRDQLRGRRTVLARPLLYRESGCIVLMHGRQWKPLCTVYGLEDTVRLQTRLQEALAVMSKVRDDQKWSTLREQYGHADVLPRLRRKAA